MPADWQQGSGPRLPRYADWASLRAPAGVLQHVPRLRWRSVEALSLCCRDRRVRDPSFLLLHTSAERDKRSGRPLFCHTRKTSRTSGPLKLSGSWLAGAVPPSSSTFCHSRSLQTGSIASAPNHRIYVRLCDRWPARPTLRQRLYIWVAFFAPQHVATRKVVKYLEVVSFG